MESDEDDIAINKDWLKMNGNAKNDGYRLGLEASTEESLQSGFNSGFGRALQMAMASGRLQGQISAGLSIPDTSSKIGGTLQEVASSSPPTPLPSLDSLLTSCSSLITQIPSYLKEERRRADRLAPLLSTAGGLGKDNSGVRVELASGERSGGDSFSVATSDSAKTVVRSDTASSGALLCAPSQPRSEADGPQERTVSSGGCERTCKNKSDFWTQLESFRDQAEALQLT